MPVALFSQHSSNPFERGGSSDARATATKSTNKFSQFLAATKESSDPISGYDVDQDQKNYIGHVANVCPRTVAQTKKYKGKGPVMARNFPSVSVDGDGGEEMVDELVIGDNKEKKRKDVVLLDDEDDEDVKGEGLIEADEQGEGEEREDEDQVMLDSSDDNEDEDDEENTLSSKTPEEREEILAEIQDLETAVPALTSDYKLLDRLGTGTFSSVYKAIDLYYHEKWHNSAWHGQHPPSSSAYYQSMPRPKGSKVYVAIKRIYVTSSPERIRNEISILSDCRSCRHVSQLVTAFRKDDQVVVVMPYQKNDDFRDYYMSLPMEGIKAYMRCLIRALRDIHARKIIHRDVKPANFLFDPRTGIGTLCDFGLACRMEPGPQHNQCLHTSPSREYPHGRVRDRKDYDAEYFRKMSKEAKFKSSQPSEKVGYPEKDTRPHSKANRAGTRGFRAPEVLLKCGDQTGAIDMWAAGMALMFFLTKKFPLFQSNDDVEALMEIAAIIGRRKMERAACLHNRMFSTNVPSISPEGKSWRDFVKNQNPDLYTPPEPNPAFYPYTEQVAKVQERRLRLLEAQDRENSNNSRNAAQDGEGGKEDTLHPPRNHRGGTPIPSSSPSHLSINTNTTNFRPPSETSLTFPSSSPMKKSGADTRAGEEEEEMLSPLTPLSGESVCDFDLGPGTGSGSGVEGAKGVKGREGGGVGEFEVELVAPTMEEHARDVENALDLVEKLMEHQSTDRITPRQALYHPFLYDGARREGGSRESGSEGSGGERVTRSASKSKSKSKMRNRVSVKNDLDQDEDMEPEFELRTRPEFASSVAASASALASTSASVLLSPESEDDLDPEDDEFFPHPFGEGVCKKWHFRDEVGEHCVRIYAEEGAVGDVTEEEQEEEFLEGYVILDSSDSENDSSGDSSAVPKKGKGKGSGGERMSGKQRTIVRRLVSGEGIAIGRQPCEFHRVGYELDMTAAVPL